MTDASWIRSLLERFEAPLTRYAFGITGDLERARDVVQDIFLRLWSESPARLEKDAGEIGAGHTVTALYEIVPHGASSEASSVDPLKYQRPLEATDEASTGELLTVKLRYKEPGGEVSRLLERPVRDEGKSYAGATADFKFAAAVASFGMMLRDSPHKGSATFDSVLELAREGVGADSQGHRAELIELVRKAKSLREP